MFKHSCNPIDSRESEITGAAEIFKAMGDLTRLRIINKLSTGRKNVSELAEAIDMTQSAVSHQLSLLKKLRIVRSAREGKSIYYYLDDDHVADLLYQCLEHVRHE